MTGPAGALTATGWSLYLPEANLAAAVPGTAGAWAHRPSPPPEQAAQILGRKGLLAKEPSTRLALCAVHRALGLAPGGRPDLPLAPRTAVVACSNLGNVGSVARVTRTVAEEGGRAVSVLDAPNVSSNVLASAIAIWFRFGGPNLMVCSGPGSGAAGLRLAGLLLRTGRADRVVLVGAEPADDVAVALHAAGSSGWPLRAGAACVVFEAGLPPGPGHAAVEPAPASELPTGPARLTIGASGVDLVNAWGDCDGANDVIALALAAHLAVDDGHGTVRVHGPAAATVRSAEHVGQGEIR